MIGARSSQIGSHLPIAGRKVRQFAGVEAVEPFTRGAVRHLLEGLPALRLPSGHALGDCGLTTPFRGVPICPSAETATAAGQLIALEVGQEGFRRRGPIGIAIGEALDETGSEALPNLLSQR